MYGARMTQACNGGLGTSPSGWKRYHRAAPRSAWRQQLGWQGGKLGPDPAHGPAFSRLRELFFSPPQRLFTPRRRKAAPCHTLAARRRLVTPPPQGQHLVTPPPQGSALSHPRRKAAPCHTMRLALGRWCRTLSCHPIGSRLVSSVPPPRRGWPRVRLAVRAKPPSGGKRSPPPDPAETRPASHGILSQEWRGRLAPCLRVWSMVR